MTRLVSLSTRDCQSFRTMPRGMSMLTSAEDSASPGTLIRMRLRYRETKLLLDPVKDNGQVRLVLEGRHHVREQTAKRAAYRIQRLSERSKLQRPQSVKNAIGIKRAAVASGSDALDQLLQCEIESHEGSGGRVRSSRRPHARQFEQPREPARATIRRSRRSDRADFAPQHAELDGRFEALADDFQRQQ